MPAVLPAHALTHLNATTRKPPFRHSNSSCVISDQAMQLLTTLIWNFNWPTSSRLTLSTPLPSRQWPPFPSAAAAAVAAAAVLSLQRCPGKQQSLLCQAPPTSPFLTSAQCSRSPMRTAARTHS